MSPVRLTIQYDPAFGFGKVASAAKWIQRDHYIWHTYTPDGPGTISVCRVAPDQVEATAWGAGDAWLIDRADAMVGNHDDPTDFHPPENLLHAWKQRPFYIGRNDQVWEELISGVFGQKVQDTKAKRSRQLLAQKFGVKAPGPYEGWALPTADQVANMAYHDFHPLGVERKRADSLLRAAREMIRVPSIASKPPEQFKRRFERVRGIGPWTTNVASAIALGDADAVPVGDYHIPNTVCWALAGEPRGNDERMLELLKPYTGHRYRVIRLAKSTGGAPKYGPRLSLTDDGMYRSQANRHSR